MRNPGLVITTGEPAGIGPDLLIQIAKHLPQNARIIGDRELLQQRAQLQNQNFDLIAPYVQHVPLKTKVTPGQLNPDNAEYVLRCLQVATDLCLANKKIALVTNPVHKAVKHSG